MFNFKKAMIVPSVAVLSLVGFVASEIPALAQDAGAPVKTHLTKRYNLNAASRRPLTVRRVARTPAATGSPVTATNGLSGPGPGPVTAATAPITGAASTLVGLPFQALGAVFPAGGPRKGGPTGVMYAGAGKEESSIDEGFSKPVPVDMAGPIFVVENGDPTINPLSLIGAPIAVAGQIAQTPFKIIGATGL